jgi:hypothetical protein
MEQENAVIEYKSIQKVKSGDNGIRDLATNSALEHTPDKTYRQYWLAKKNRS